MTKMNANARRDRAASASASTGRPRKAAAPLSNRRGNGALEGAANGELAGGAGLFAGVIELSTDASLRVRLSNGELVTASAAPGLDARLVDECLRDRRTILVAAGLRGPVVLGALQTSASTMESREGRTRIAGKEIEIEAGARIALRVGKSALVIEEDGSVRFVGDRMSLRMASLLKVLSANVELP